MHNKKIVSALTIGSLLTFAAVLGAFAPIPVADPSVNSNVRIQVMDPSDGDASNTTTDYSSERSNSSADIGATAPDNSAMNEGSESKHSLTADKADNKASDRAMMSQIRKAVIADGSLSTNAHNVKIIAHNGKITLKGPVQSDQEKQSIEAKAVEIAGHGKVVNKLTVQQGNY